jgi:hypothetical protein
MGTAPVFVVFVSGGSGPITYVKINVFDRWGAATYVDINAFP